MVASGFAPSAAGVAGCYADFLDTLLIADEDCPAVPAIEAVKVVPICTDIRMDDIAAKRRLAREVLALVKK
jgi:LPPG:FO 2-phospho-L-lactate transferase